jgi:hypothetical protein
MRLALPRPAHSERHAQTFHPLFQASEELRLAKASVALYGRCRQASARRTPAAPMSEATIAAAQAFYRLSKAVRGLKLAAQMHAAAGEFSMVRFNVQYPSPFRRKVKGLGRNGQPPRIIRLSIRRSLVAGEPSPRGRFYKELTGRCTSFIRPCQNTSGTRRHVLRRDNWYVCRSSEPGVCSCWPPASWRSNTLLFP